jgi:hypothetical protein
MFATTTWLMFPWQATRIALETQRVMTFSVLRLLSGPHTQTASPGLNDRDAVPIPAESVTITPHKTVAAQRSLGVNKKRLRPTNKRSKRKGKGKRR